jgi:hypothetical protein
MRGERQRIAVTWLEITDAGRRALAGGMASSLAARPVAHSAASGFDSFCARSRSRGLIWSRFFARQRLI